jgi:hypothetical protein
MVDWLQLASFIAAGLVVIVAQNAFHDAADAEDGLRSKDRVLAEVFEHPSAFLRISATEVHRLLRALLRPHHSPRVERRRRLALVAVIVFLVVFAWIVVD